MKIAYIVSRYPAVSHTFILREVCALRKLGWDVSTFSMRRVSESELLSAVDKAEYANTSAILPAGAACVIMSHLFLAVTGPVRYVQTLLEALTKRPAGWRNAIWYFFYFIEAGLFARQLQRRKINHVHAHFANVAANVAKLAVRMCGGSWSLTLHGLSDFGDPQKSNLEDKIHSASCTICVSDSGRAHAMMQSMPADWGKICCVHTGVDTTLFTPAQPRKNGDTKTVQLLNVARLGPEKGLEFLIHALRQVVDRGVDVYLTIVGEGPERARIEAEIDRHELRDRVTLAGAIGQDTIQDYFDRADVFVLSSLAEGLPVVLMEAMAKELPVIATQIAGIPELVEHRNTGLLVSPGRADQLADAIVHLASDAEARDAYGRRGRAKVCAEFEQVECARQLAQIFSDRVVPSMVQSEKNSHPSSIKPVEI